MRAEMKVAYERKRWAVSLVTVIDENMETEGGEWSGLVRVWRGVRQVLNAEDGNDGKEEGRG
jgi:hypothetical protein